MTIQNLYPKARPQIIYNIVNGRPDLPVQAQFSRSSEALYVDKDGLIKAAAVDQPRFRYNPLTGELMGVLLESRRVNKISPFTTGWQSSVPAGSNVTWSANNATAPDGTQTAGLAIQGVSGSCRYFDNLTIGGKNTENVFSIFAKAYQGNSTLSLSMYSLSGYNTGTSFVIDIETGAYTGDGGRVDIKVEKYRDGWRRVSYRFKNPVTDTTCTWATNPGRFDSSDTSLKGLYLWWPQVEELDSTSDGSDPTTPITWVSGGGVREKDIFSLASVSQFDNGFSLLLDSDADNLDFVYKIKANSTEIASLENSNGTLDWSIDGNSAVTDGTFPQVGFVKGRTRTISSFGPAGGGDVENVLYTPGVVFSTTAEPASGADEIEFGVPQTLKALYVWNGQLDTTSAVSLIKGQYNIVPSGPIAADAYSFAYDTDPDSLGNKDITLPYIVPTVSMTIDWGDGTSNTYEQGVVPSHSYPYPGKYRIQIEADDGFDSVRLGDVDDTIVRVEQWAPQHRVGASGGGFTGDELNNILSRQAKNDQIPPFKYTALTELVGSFNLNNFAACNGWDYVATDLQSCVILQSAYASASRYTATAQEKNTFPQLQTSSLLTQASSCFSNIQLTGFVDPNGVATNRPFSDTSNASNLDYVVYNNSLTDIDLDLQSCTTIISGFFNNNFVTFPNLQTGNIQNFTNTWQNCSQLQSFPSLDFSSATTVSGTWNGCTAMASFASTNFGNVTNFTSTWENCSSLTSFPASADFSSANTLQNTWAYCSSLTSFPSLDLSSATNLQGAWSYSGLTSFPALALSSATKANSAWRNSSLASFPSGLTLPACTSFQNAWRGCTQLVSFPALSLPAGTNFDSAWRGCSNLTTFPAMSFPNAMNFPSAWGGCSLTAASIENILVALDSAGNGNGTLGIADGNNESQQNWTAAANAAYNSLIFKGWTIDYNP